MHVLQVNSAPGWAGGEAHTLALCAGLPACGCAVTLACRAGSAIAERAAAMHVPVFTPPLRHAVDLPSALQLARFCRRQGVDVLHAHQARDYPLAALAGMLAPELRVVVTRHLLFPLQTGSFSRWMWRRIDAVIAVSAAVRNVVAAHPDIAPEKIVMIPNGIETARFSAASPSPLREELALPSDARLVGIVGTLGAAKGQQVLLRAWPRVLAAQPRAVLLIVGDDQHGGSYQVILEHLSAELGITPSVRFLGHRRDIPGIMQALDILVLASSNEPFGLVLVEAMAAATPVVATNAGGAPEIVVEGETGLLVPPERSDLLADAVVNLLADRTLADRFARAGQQRALALFDYQTMVARTYACYAGVNA